MASNTTKSKTSLTEQLKADVPQRNQGGKEKELCGQEGKAAPIDDPLTALRTLSCFKQFNAHELQEILPLSEIRGYPPETVILREGDDSDNRVYFLLTGGVSVYVADNFILKLKRSGDIFGEMSLISQELRSATVKTDEKTTLLELSSALTFDPGARNYYKFRYFFSRMFNTILADKLRMTSERAGMYEHAVRRNEQITEQSVGLQEQIRQHLDQIRVYSHLVQSAKDTIVIINTSGIILEANDALEIAFGIPGHKQTGIAIAELLQIPEKEEQGWPGVFDKASSGGWNGEVLVMHGTKDPIPADCSISLVQNENAEALAYSVIFRDIRERKAFEEKILAQSAELEKINRELRELDRLKDNFMTLVSHELRTPLSSIIAYAEALTIEGMVEPEEQREFLQTIHSESLRLGELVNKVLSISKIESGQMAFEFKEGRLDELVTYMAANYRPKALSKALQLDVRIDENFHSTHYDPGQIQDVLREILDNALKFTDSGSIRVKATQNETESLIQVQDTGKGMEGNVLIGARNKFDWVENIGHHQSGIGLGLPLSFLIVDAHSGQLELQSAAGEGTTVSIRLPHRPNSRETSSRTM
ncbi:MAG: ATP-binding protein [SAR324 cluster bacterium]|nr:ATP-binding protein [SAR324 cluster bacterium]